MSESSLIHENRERLIRIEGELAHVKESVSRLSGKLENGIAAQVKDVVDRTSNLEARTTNLENWRKFVTRIHWTVFATGLAALLTTLGNLILLFYK